MSAPSPNFDDSSPPSAAFRLVRLLLFAVVDIGLALHLAAAGFYWWLSPKGFPVNTSRFWLNTVLPIVLLAAALVGIVAMHRRRLAGAAVFVAAFAAAWCAAAIAGRIVFPVSLRWAWLLALGIGLAGFVCFALLQWASPASRRAWLAASLAGALVGVLAICAQIAPAPSTSPLNIAPPDFADARAPVPMPNAQDREALQLTDDFQVDPRTGEIVLTAGAVELACWPLLEFDRLSPDRFWSLLAPATRGRRELVRQSIEQLARTLLYSDDSVLALRLPADGSGTIEAEAYTPLSTDTYSHLNAFCRIRVTGHQQLSLSFSPCAESHIEVLPADYPVGRPARLAYFRDPDQFRVVEATSGEKGPFRELATGELRRGEPLTIGFFDRDRAVATVTLDDWSAQASTDLSPTAGWRLPQNAIEFQRLGERLSAPVEVWISLASTSVGRGWETVGHAAGTYRNRLTITAKQSTP